MNIKVVYHSATGNTKKLAETIASTLNTTAMPISKGANQTSEVIDLLFIGDGIYFGKPNKSMVEFISHLNPNTIRNVAVFATYGGQEKIGSDLQKMLKDKGLKVIGKPFISKGQSWLLINRNRPNETDIQECGTFARGMVEKIEN